ncbi:immunoglobulin alpha-2 heavy chain-like [Polymixia lowei]
MSSGWMLVSLVWVQSLYAAVEALVFQSPSSVMVTQGSNITLSCDVSGMSRQCSQVVWLHVGPLKTLSVLNHYSIKTRTDTLCYLDISNIRLKDAGTYYCVYLNNPMLIIGNGTALAVTEPVSHSPVVDLLMPADRQDDPFTSVPLVCLVSGLEEPGRATVDWEVDGMDGLPELTPRVLPEREAGVISVQVNVPGDTWVRGAEVSCVLSLGDMTIKKTVSSIMGKSSQHVLLFSCVGTVCVILLVFTMTLIALLSCRRRRPRFNRGPVCQSEVWEDLSSSCG